MRPRDWLLIPLTVGLAAGGLVWGGRNTYVSLRNRSIVDVTCAEFVAHPPSTQWVRLHDCVPDFDHLGVETSRHERSGFETVSELYVPLRAPTESLGERAKLVLSIDDGPLLALGGRYSIDSVRRYAEDVLSRPIDGLIELSVDRGNRERARLRELALHLEDEFAIVGYGARPRPVWLSIGALGVGLGATALLVRRIRRARRDRIELARARLVRE